MRLLLLTNQGKQNTAILTKVVDHNSKSLNLGVCHRCIKPSNQPYSLPLQTFVKQWVILKISQNLSELM